MADTMLSTTNLTKQYGRLCAVNNVTVDVKQGSIVGLVGKNGAGKTTLIRILTGLVKPTSGTFELLPEKTRANTDVAAIVERPSIYTDMSAMNNLTTQCKLLGLATDTDYLKETIELVGLNPDSKQIAKKYSLGMKQRLAIAMTLVGKPKLLILDEPTNGLDPQGMHDMRKLFATLNRNFGTTIIISSHILGELAKLATDYMFMDKGRILKQLSAKELENVAQKRIRVTVDDVAKAQSALEQFGKSAVTSPNTVELTGDTPPTQILLTLAQNGVSASNIVNVGDDLEDFFIDLVQNHKEGGAK
ncbi:MAG: ABC transporter ATP-binding protein [Corallococcus sp.]|nr:ABC transporter ATP-binding protein [Corallococcus sp.]